ncbi:MAG: PadR family transcriptional regulator [bacterium]|nr:PadR family transcriptional regulator [bacterium]
MKQNHISELRLAIIGLISMQPQSGYSLRKFFSTTPMGRFSSSPGAIYPALKRLEEEGWIAGAIDNADSLRPKKVYSLTEEGTRALHLELTKAVTREDIIWNLDGLILRFPFIEQLGLSEVLRFLTQFEEEVSRYIPTLENYLDGVSEEITLCGRLAMQQGIDGYRGMARWARHAIEEISTHRPDPTQGEN